MLVGTLKATDLVRVKLVNNELIEQETLVKDLSRIRDIEIDAAGLIYLLLEHEGGGKIVKVSPADSQTLAKTAP
jgi:glucose/arabinose dehydrogenase